MPKKKALFDTMENTSWEDAALLWEKLYESASERASKGEREIKRLYERIWKLEQQVADWKARYLNRSALDARNDQG